MYLARLVLKQKASREHKKQAPKSRALPTPQSSVAECLLLRLYVKAGLHLLKHPVAYERHQCANGKCSTVEYGNLIFCLQTRTYHHCTKWDCPYQVVSGNGLNVTGTFCKATGRQLDVALDPRTWDGTTTVATTSEVTQSLSNKQKRELLRITAKSDTVATPKNIEFLTDRARCFFRHVFFSREYFSMIDSQLDKLYQDLKKQLSRHRQSPVVGSSFTEFLESHSLAYFIQLRHRRKLLCVYDRRGAQHAFDKVAALSILLWGLVKDRSQFNVRYRRSHKEIAYSFQHHCLAVLYLVANCTDSRFPIQKSQCLSVVLPEINRIQRHIKVNGKYIQPNKVTIAEKAVLQTLRDRKEVSEFSHVFRSLKSICICGQCHRMLP